MNFYVGRNIQYFTYLIVLPQSVQFPGEGPSNWGGGGVFCTGFGAANGTFVLTVGCGFGGENWTFVLGGGCWGLAVTVGGILEGLKMGEAGLPPGVGECAVNNQVKERINTENFSEHSKYSN